MKIFLLLLIAFAAGMLPVAAAPADFDVKTEARCLSKERTSTNLEKIRKEQWAYNVTIENKSAKDHAGLEVKYIVFASDVTPGSKAPPKLVRKPGTKNIDTLKSHGKTTFATEPVEITKSQLSGGVTWGSGARPRSNEALEGIWIRIYANGELLAEISRPPALATRESWEKK
jgi:hypothetical protein